MYQNKILDAYKATKNYVQDKQIAHDLGVTPQKICKIRTGERYLTETEALFMAETIGLDAEEVLVYLASDRSKTHKAQQAWANIAKKFNRQGLQSFSVLLGAFSSASLLLNTSTTECVLCTIW
ncbi:DUF3693 domain-containing protein [Vibrio sp. Of7-15]|uniref:DUF3693 domain-containing protein n=1 Tax=Vibrio sp. Of7-15 TaxID=2724879 RepID=UPI001EF200FB|nr:DUF3693 domain-containing protein [Vibrio sp. Of7-15]MCG7500057.1 DUF3693 domain-containing protein [Vibrio sp. Of7-15]